MSQTNGTPPEYEVFVTVAVTKDGRFTISGNIDNEPLAVYLLDRGIDTVKKFHREREIAEAQQKRAGGVVGLDGRPFGKG